MAVENRHISTLYPSSVDELDVNHTLPVFDNTPFGSDDVPLPVDISNVPTEVLIEKSILLAQGRLYYNSLQVPTPPHVTSVNRLVDLDEMWDDTSPQWGHSSAVMIKGTPIALIYWPQIYQYQRSSWWKRMTQQWTQWKVILSWHYSESTYTPADLL